MPTNLQKLENDGYYIPEPICDTALIGELKNLLSNLQADDNDAVRKKNGDIFGVRNVLSISPVLWPMIKGSPIFKMAQELLGDNARIVRSIYFDKTINSNWKVPIHQDNSIAVTQKHEVEGFAPWSVKAGVPHTQPPEKILDKMVTFRVHLDKATEDNGALRVISGSHKHGKMKQDDIVKFRNQSEIDLCEVDEGAIMVMRPLLLHESSAGQSPSRRRVLHLELSADRLPTPLEWHENYS